MVDVISDTVEQRSVASDTTDQELQDLLGSQSFHNTAEGVVTSTILPILQLVADDPDVGDVSDALTDVIDGITEQAAAVTNTFEYTEDSADVSELVSEFVMDQVLANGPITNDDLSNIQEGSSTVEEAVVNAGGATEIQQGIEDLVMENPELIEGGSAALEGITNELSPGVWGNSDRGSFIWG